MLKIYIAGPLFTRGERLQRYNESEYISRCLDGWDIEHSIYNPCSATINDKTSNPTAEMIYIGDIKEIDDCDLVIADLSNPSDSGTFAEVGYAVAKGKTVFGHVYDLRMESSGNYESFRTPWGMNQFVVGMLLEEPNANLFTNFEGMVEHILDTYS